MFFSFLFLGYLFEFNKEKKEGYEECDDHTGIPLLVTCQPVSPTLQLVCKSQGDVYR